MSFRPWTPKPTFSLQGRVVVIVIIVGAKTSASSSSSSMSTSSSSSSQAGFAPQWTSDQIVLLACAGDRAVWGLPWG